MNYIQPCLFKALTRSHTVKKTTAKKLNNKISKKKKNTFFTAKIQHLHLKAPSNNVKTQSEKSFFNFTFSLL